MLRLAVFLGLAAGLAAGHALASEASTSFGVGITITGNADRTPSMVAPASSRWRQYTWGAAEVSLLRAGYSRPLRGRSTGKLYWFLAERGGTRFRVAVSMTSGEIVKVMPV